MKKTIIILLTALLALSVFVACDQDTILDDMFDGGSEPGPTPVEILYIDANTEVLTGGKTYTIDENVTIENARLTIDGTDPVTILLPAGKTLTVQKGITVTEGQTLIINEDGTKGTEIGKLIAGGTGTTPTYAAGIGGVNESGKKNAGTITINGGTVTATGGSYGSGIGGGWKGTGGTISISGGSVTANGGENAAGIGGGCLGAGGTVTINGGIVTANGIYGGAGIGRGCDGSSDGTLEIGDGVHVYETGSGSPYADGPQDNVTTRYQNMTVTNYN